jgi:hypothetical protein
MKFLHIFTSLLSLTSLAYGHGHEFSDSETATLERGGVVMREQRVPNELWPLLTSYLYLEASPAVSMALFAAYDHQKNYVPNVTKSTPIKQASPLEVEVRYRLKMPWPISDARYTHGHRLSQVSVDESEILRLDWWMIESTSADFVQGHVEFHKLSPGRTLMIYQNQVRPKSGFARLFREAMVRDVTRTLEAIKNEIYEHRDPETSELTRRYLEKLELSLAGQKVWLPPATQ